MMMTSQALPQPQSSLSALFGRINSFSALPQSLPKPRATLILLLSSPSAPAFLSAPFAYVGSYSLLPGLSSKSRLYLSYYCDQHRYPQQPVCIRMYLSDLNPSTRSRYRYWTRQESSQRNHSLTISTVIRSRRASIANTGDST